MVHDDLLDRPVEAANSDDWTPPKFAVATFGVLFSMHLLDYLDRNLLTSIQPQILKSMPGLTNEQWGLLPPIFLVTYSVISPAMGWLGDRYRRTRLLAIGIGIWSLATVGTGLAQDFNHLVLARSFLGIGEATYGVIAPTILIDLFSRKTRSRLMSAFYLAMPIGAAAGIILGPILANRLGWHRAFFLVGIPGFAAAILVLFLPEPIRGASEAIDPDRLKKHQKTGTSRADYVDLMVNSSYTYSVFGQAAYTFAVGGLLIWVPNYLFRTREFNQEQASTILGLVTLGAALCGMIAGGRLSDSLAKTRPGMMFVVPGVAMLMSIPFVIAALLSRSPWVIYPCIFMAEALMFVNTGPCTAIIANVVQPNLRAAAFAISTFAVHFLGDIWSPWLIAKASTLCADPETMATPFGKALASIGAIPTPAWNHRPREPRRRPALHHARAVALGDRAPGRGQAFAEGDGVDAGEVEGGAGRYLILSRRVWSSGARLISPSNRPLGRPRPARPHPTKTGEILAMIPINLSPDEWRRRAKRELERKLLEGLRGPMIVLDDEEWDSIEREILKRFDHERPRS